MALAREACLDLLLAVSEEWGVGEWGSKWRGGYQLRRCWR